MEKVQFWGAAIFASKAKVDDFFIFVNKAAAKKNIESSFFNSDPKKITIFPLLANCTPSAFSTRRYIYLETSSIVLHVRITLSI